MSLEYTQETATNRVPESRKQNWTDLNMDGRKLTMIINDCFHKSYGPMRLKSGQKRPDIDPELYFAYVDRMIKAISTKEKLVRIVLGVDELIAEAKKK
jgi:hypothetical protein